MIAPHRPPFGCNYRCGRMYSREAVRSTTILLSLDDAVYGAHPRAGAAFLNWRLEVALGPRRNARGIHPRLALHPMCVDGLRLRRESYSGAPTAAFTTPARTAVGQFLNAGPQGRNSTPISLTMDNVASETSCPKLYFHTTQTSFASVRHIMTLGGVIAAPEV